MSNFEELAKTVAELKQEVDRLKAARECSNLVGRWLFYAPACRFEEICSLWAQHSKGLVWKYMVLYTKAFEECVSIF